VSAAHLGTALTKVEPFLPDVGWFIERGKADQDLPLYPNAAMAVNIGKSVRADGARVVLNGEGGDAFLGGAAHYFAEHLSERDWRSLVRSAREDAVELGWSETARNIWRYGVGPLVPEPLRRMRRRYRQSQQPDPPLLSPSLRALLRERRAGYLVRPQAAPAQRILFDRLTDPFNSYCYEFLTREWSRDGYEGRSPMASRTVVEFAFATPQRLRVRGDLQKHVHREAMVGLLPEAVVRRRSKAAFNICFDRVLDKALAAVINVFPHCGMETFIDSAVLHSRCLRGDPGLRNVYEEWAAFGLWVLMLPGQAGR
jgi:asparagine synthase (glutamine-hydrolysing)